MGLRTSGGMIRRTLMNSNDTRDGVVEDVDLEWFEELLKDCILMCMLIFCNTLCVCTKRLDNGPQLFICNLLILQLPQEDL